MIVKNHDNSVLLTFDDGPTEYLSEILSILDEKNVQGVFFWQSNLLTNGTPWKRVLSNGHLIGSHAHSHPNFEELIYEEQYEEVRRSKEMLEKMIGNRIEIFRPPYGLYDSNTHRVANELNLRIILWKVASWDWKHGLDEVDDIVENVVDNVSKGDIVLLHELPQTIEALPRIIDGIRQKGLVLAEPSKKRF
ncbi:polysaccharide deacetylase family protein [Salirhabdus salicampi]|uniref:polysaccharide deacetylase family protein n=1 Tax=Salirhabdus salicampi TaxID=476102 RepID=UPI0020C25314|nr:polysaccharide deacetylase family protein [Salirhabdus salicampi]